jgi:hypothetical protein
MAEPRLISDYLAELSAQLPAPIVTELADGLGQTHQRYLGQGLDPGAAAKAALAEFGGPQEVVAAFTRASPARRTARTLLATGPLAGACWATVLITKQAWTWPITARILPAGALITVVALLATAARSTHYRTTSRAAATACLGLTALDATVLTVTAVLVPALTWPIILATTVSTARIAYTTRALHAIQGPLTR